MAAFPAIIARGANGPLKKSYLARKLQDKMYPLVYERDECKCQWPGCGKYTTIVHHIVPRGHGGKKSLEVIWSLPNMVMLCVDHHGPMAHTREAKIRLLAKLQRKHGYEYSDTPFSEYIL